MVFVHNHSENHFIVLITISLLPVSSVGERVCLIGATNHGKNLLDKMLREEVEKDIPFQFVDDLRVSFCIGTNFFSENVQNMFFVISSCFKVSQNWKTLEKRYGKLKAWK